MSTTSKQHVLQKLKAQHPTMRHYGVRRYGLFGSFARNEATIQSDVDLLVEFKPEHKTFLNFSNLAFFLEEILQRRVELLTPESLSPYMSQEILQSTDFVSVA
ncbi:MAG: nucleotidyltransferase family protein [Chloroflexota bacterium]